IARVNMSLGTVLSSAGGCYLEYTRATNTLTLGTDTGAAWAGSAVLGTPGWLANSRCAVDAGASAAAGAGANLTVSLAIAFQTPFAGAQNIYLSALDSAGSFSGWQALGTWTVNTAPSPLSVAPSSGTGPSQVFSLVYSDPNGFADIVRANVALGATLSPVGSCYLEYTRATNTLVLASDSGGTWVGSVTLGTAGSLANSQCQVDALTSSATGVGSALTLNLSLVFRSPFAGPRNIYLGALDSVGNFSGWQALGTWTVNPPPVAVSVAPWNTRAPPTHCCWPTTPGTRGPPPLSWDRPPRCKTAAARSTRRRPPHPARATS
ncbi:MAG: hypothetical protein HY013_13680, partial [Candidatus Solibacter usitatus]|nr:hypothetical protein [Candidatus Solibacter usitatus]